MVAALLLGGSIFAFVPTILHDYSAWKTPEQKKTTQPIANDAHPLIGISDNTSICGNDGSTMHEIYLCGATDNRLLAPNIANAQSIVWEKFVEGSCNPANLPDNCAKSFGQCQWQQLSSNTQFNVQEDGEYRIVVTYLDGTFDRYYFNVTSNGLNPVPQVTNVDCGIDGSVTINNVSGNYEFSINNGANWQDSKHISYYFRWYL